MPAPQTTTLADMGSVLQRVKTGDVSDQPQGSMRDELLERDGGAGAPYSVGAEDALDDLHEVVVAPGCDAADDVSFAGEGPWTVDPQVRVAWTPNPKAIGDLWERGDCVYECNRHILSAWLAGKDADTEAPAYIRNQLIQEAVYESAETGRKMSV